MACVAAVPVAQGAFTGSLVYDNSTHYQNGWLYSGFELGDEINLSGAVTYRELTGFNFEYYGVNFSGNERARVRFYMNDGAVGGSGYATPGTKFFDSGLFAVTEPGTADNRGTMNFQPADFVTGVTLALTQPLPDSFTWTVQFYGVDTAGGEQAGLSVYAPPTVGSGFTDYWQQEGTALNPDWKLLTNPFGAIDFGAQFYAVPEPSTFALVLLGAGGLGGLLWRRRRQGR